MQMDFYQLGGTPPEQVIASIADKILAQDGRVTLKGPVRSDQEKTAILSKAMGIAGEGNVTDQMDVAPPKS